MKINLEPEVLEQASRAFAEAYAVFMASLIRQLDGAPMLSSADADEVQTIRQLNKIGEVGSFDDAPDWVKEAYERSKSTPGATMPEGEVRRRVAASKLVLALHDKGMTQADVARKLKKSPAAISRIFRNPERCRVKTLREVAVAIGEDLSDIL